MGYLKIKVALILYIIIVLILYLADIVRFEKISPLWVLSVTIVNQTIVYLTYIKNVFPRSLVDKTLGWGIFLVLLVSGFEYVDDLLVAGFLSLLITKTIQLLNSKSLSNGD